MILLILAGGLGSRFGGAKQIEPIDDFGNYIIDYSVYDAIRAGFEKIVIVTKPEYEQILHDTLIKRIGNKAEVKIAFQTMDQNATKKFNFERQKPLGTGHAILSAKNFLTDNFCTINADDFYGKNSYIIAHDFLKNTDKNTSHFALIGYNLQNTLSQSGAVKRGVCEIKNGYVQKIEESSVGLENDRLFAKKLCDEKFISVNPNTIVSMNMFCFTPKFLSFLQQEYNKFISSKQNFEKGEFLLPDIVAKMIATGMADLKILQTDEKWIGMTYKNDKIDVIKKIKQLANNGIYNKNLWKNQ